MGAFIIVVGVGIFGTFTGYLANLFLGSKPVDEEVAANRVGRRNSATTEPSPATLDELRTALAKSEETLAEMRTLLDRYAGA